mmetsp:Transcript_67455/g.190149  ORF Transcript_67455/g.190149 Transcript_67455/m.190149 type:complete len:375 (+) Transcript_67455:78-1202(+)
MLPRLPPLYRSLGRCCACLLLAAVAAVASLVLDTLSPRGQWAVEAFPGSATLALLSGAARTVSTVDDLRSSLGPHDQLIAEAGSNVSVVVAVALTLHKLGQTYNYSHPKAAWWAKAIFDINKRHCALHRIPLVLRQAPVTHSRRQLEACDRKAGNNDRWACREDLYRQASTWGKMLMMRDLLQLRGVAYVLCLDADAVFAHTERDTMRRVARRLEASPGKDLIIAKEDWRHKGRRSVNTGVMLARSTDFTRALFGDLVSSFHGGSAYAGPGGRCRMNEQMCLQRWLGQRLYPNISDRVLAVSSLGHNFSPCSWYWCPNMFPAVDKKHACHACWLEESCRHECDLPLNDSRIDVVHFLGDSKFYLELVMPLLPQP